MRIEIKIRGKNDEYVATEFEGTHSECIAYIHDLVNAFGFAYERREERNSSGTQKEKER